MLIEELTDRDRAEARALLERIDAAGGTLAAIEQGMIQREIQESAYRAQQAIDSGASVVVGVNQFATTDAADDRGAAHRSRDRAAPDRARARGARRRETQAAWRSALDAVGAAARGTDNLVPVDHPGGGGAGDGRRDLRRDAAVFGEHTEIDV